MNIKLKYFERHDLMTMEFITRKRTKSQKEKDDLTYMLWNEREDPLELASFCWTKRTYIQSLNDYKFTIHLKNSCVTTLSYIFGDYIFKENNNDNFKRCQ